MKTIFLIPILFLLFTGCEKVKEDKIVELPNDITKVEPIVNLLDSLKVTFSENSNPQTNYPFLFSDTIQKNVVLKKESLVYVTFIDEFTDKKNSLFWYSYNLSDPPSGISDIKGDLIFPNLSKIGEGGLLESGATVQLGTGKFPAGTVIGFYIIANGWNDGTIRYSNPTYYTNYSFNNGGEQFHVLFKNSYSHYLVMGFEDNVNPGRDYNDVLFAVSDNIEGNEATSFDLNKVVVK